MSKDALRFLSFEGTLEVSSASMTRKRQEKKVPPHQTTALPRKADEVRRLDRDFVSYVHTRVECKTAMRSWRLLRRGETSLAIKKPVAMMTTGLSRCVTRCFPEPSMEQGFG